MYSHELANSKTDNEMILRICFLSLFTTLFQSTDQSPEPYYSVEIEVGGATDGMMALRLNKEGLILKRALPDGDWEINFVHRDDLNYGDVSRLQEFVIQHTGFETFESKYVHSVNAMSVPTVYIIRNKYSDCGKYILDKNYMRYPPEEKEDRQALDSLVILMNNIVPGCYKEYRIRELHDSQEVLE